MNILIVYAHPEPRSFNGRMKNLAFEELTALGHSVAISDLYAMKFDAVAGIGDFIDPLEGDYFNLQEQQDHAAATATFVPQIADEIEKLKKADLVIFQFPLWWQSVPAILKGWFDRVLARGFAYGRGQAFDTGGLRGRRAMCSVTTGSPESILQPDGFYGRTLDELLRPVLHGTLAFSGFDVLPTFCAYSAARVPPEEQETYLAAYRAHLRIVAGAS